MHLSPVVASFLQKRTSMTKEEQMLQQLLKDWLKLAGKLIALHHVRMKDITQGLRNNPEVLSLLDKTDHSEETVQAYCQFFTQEVDRLSNLANHKYHTTVFDQMDTLWQNYQTALNQCRTQYEQASDLIAKIHQCNHNISQEQLSDPLIQYIRHARMTNDFATIPHVMKPNHFKIHNEDIKEFRWQKEHTELPLMVAGIKEAIQTLRHTCEPLYLDESIPYIARATQAQWVPPYETNLFQHNKLIINAMIYPDFTQLCIGQHKDIPHAYNYFINLQDDHITVYRQTADDNAAVCSPEQISWKSFLNAWGDITPCIHEYIDAYQSKLLPSILLNQIKTLNACSAVLEDTVKNYEPVLEHEQAKAQFTIVSHSSNRAWERE